MALENPEALVALQDSLLQKDISSNQIKSLIVAHNKIGDSALEGGDYKKAIMHFSSAVQLLSLIHI